MKTPAADDTSSNHNPLSIWVRNLNRKHGYSGIAPPVGAERNWPSVEHLILMRSGTNETWISHLSLIMIKLYSVSAWVVSIILSLSKQVCKSYWGWSSIKGADGWLRQNSWGSPGKAEMTNTGKSLLKAENYLDWIKKRSAGKCERGCPWVETIIRVIMIIRNLKALSLLTWKWRMRKKWETWVEPLDLVKININRELN